MKKNPMLDETFLKALDLSHLKEVYVRIVSLSLNNEPITEISGSVVSGSINVDGKSSVRRTCNLQLVTRKAYSQTDVDWALHTRCAIYIGLRNMINPEYDDVIWFKMGIYILTSYSVSSNSEGYSISLQGKDKMCLLNGDINGHLFAETDFGSRWEQIVNTNRYTKTDIPIKTIIREAVHEYAVEPYSNIVINDLDTCGVELLNYRARQNPIYVYTIKSGNTVSTQMCFEDSEIGNVFKTGYSVDGISIFWKHKYQDALGKWHEEEIYRGDGLSLMYNGNLYTILKRADYGETIGFRATDLTYAGDLIVGVGEPITSLLDKIVQMLGDFEYYYDLDGRFIFQRKRIYQNVSWSNAKVSTESNGYNGTEIYYDNTAYTSIHTYVFEGGQLIESYNNQPQLTAIKNDFSIWGAMKGVSQELPIHIRCAIDEQPERYYSKLDAWVNNHIDYWRSLKINENSIITPDTSPIWLAHAAGGQYDWRQLIYKMAQDCFKLRGVIDDITTELNSPSRIWSAEEREQTIQYLTEWQKIYNDLLNNGYAAYYTDILGFWSDLYRIDRTPYIKYKYDERGNVKLVDGIAVEDPATTFSITDWEEWRANGFWNPHFFRYNALDNSVEIYNTDGLVFWFDFLPPTASGLQAYSIQKIGRRSKVINDNTITSIFVRDTPNVLFIDPSADEVQWQGDLHYARMNIPAMYQNYFSMSSQGKSAKEVLDQTVYECTYYNDTISLNAIPVYYLEPNTRIKVYDETTGIDGDYLINSLSYSLAHDGMMSVSATRAEKRIL